MQLLFGFAVAASLLLASLAGAQAQIFAPQKPPCFDDFMALRGDAEKRFATATELIKRKASAAELCRSFTQFADSLTKVIKFVEQNSASCPFPPELLPGMKQNHTKSLEFRKQACTAAQGPPKPAAPSLSEALGAPIPNANTTQTGRGTLDSLSGNPLAR